MAVVRGGRRAAWSVAAQGRYPGAYLAELHDQGPGARRRAPRRSWPRHASGPTPPASRVRPGERTAPVLGGYRRTGRGVESEEIGRERGRLDGVIRRAPLHGRDAAKRGQRLRWADPRSIRRPSSQASSPEGQVPGPSEAPLGGFAPTGYFPPAGLLSARRRSASRGSSPVRLQGRRHRRVADDGLRVALRPGRRRRDRCGSRLPTTICSSKWTDFIAPTLSGSGPAPAPPDLPGGFAAAPPSAGNSDRAYSPGRAVPPRRLARRPDSRDRSSQRTSPSSTSRIRAPASVSRRRRPRRASGPRHRRHGGTATRSSGWMPTAAGAPRGQMSTVVSWGYGARRARRGRTICRTPLVRSAPAIILSGAELRPGVNLPGRRKTKRCAQRRHCSIKASASSSQ